MSYSHEAHPALQVHSEVRDGKVKLIQGRLDVADGQPQPAQVAGQVAFPAEEASRERQQDVSASLWGASAGVRLHSLHQSYMAAFKHSLKLVTLSRNEPWLAMRPLGKAFPQQRPGQPRRLTSRLEQGWRGSVNPQTEGSHWEDSLGTPLPPTPAPLLEKLAF